MEYFLNFNHMINIGTDDETHTFGEIISSTENIVNIIVGIVAIIGGFAAIMYFRKLREKRLNASFSYLSRLKVRIHYLHGTYKIYSEDIMRRFVPEDSRRSPESSKSLFIKKVIDNFSNLASETLEFLKNTDDQMPSGIGWTSMLDKFLVFLEDCEKINIENFYLWSDLENKDEYISSNLNNMEEMLNLIETYQTKIEQKICK